MLVRLALVSAFAVLLAGTLSLMLDPALSSRAAQGTFSCGMGGVQTCPNGFRASGIVPHAP